MVFLLKMYPYRRADSVKIVKFGVVCIVLDESKTTNVELKVETVEIPELITFLAGCF
jgi:hypothetical protein